MAGKKHQFILGLIIKKIREDGFTIISIDGNCSGSFGNKTQLPPKIMRHRPDVIAIKENGSICIGEAKTDEDINSTRTYEQLIDYTNTEINGRRCNVILGVPKSSMDVFKKYLYKNRLIENENFFVLYVPDEIINE